MKSEKLFRFGIIVTTLIVMNVFRGWFIFNVIMSVFASLMGDDTLTYTIASITTTIVIGVCATPLIQNIFFLPLGMVEIKEKSTLFWPRHCEEEARRRHLFCFSHPWKSGKETPLPTHNNG